MRHCLVLSLLVTLGLGLSGETRAQDKPFEGIIVVANTSHKNLSLSKQQIRSLFTGSSLGYKLEVVTLPRTSIVRVAFNTKIIGLTEDRIQAYWAQMRFSGRKKQPKELDSEKSLIAFLLTKPGSVTYLPASSEVPAGLSIIYRSEGL